ncbi:MAG: GEVED domain-containing protein [Schleiferiaceae bacterium]|nr:GEVED domain-containing protein [Schleiferiaceae bacterium]
MKHFLFLGLFLIVGIVQVSGQTYCAGGPTSAFDSEIASVTLIGQTSSINYSQTCPGTIGLNNQTAVHNADLSVGHSYTLNVNFGTCGNFNFNAGTAYIDFNGDGIFSPSEAVGTTLFTMVPFSRAYTFTVPAGAVMGTTRMRVIQREGGTTPPLDPCATFYGGSVIDFGITIVPSSMPCTGAAVTAALASSKIICVGDSVNLSATGVSFGAGTVFQWQSSPDSTNWTNLAGPLTVNRNSGTLATTTYFRLQVTCGSTTVISSGVKVEVFGTSLAAGTYTINSTAATGGSNFSSFNDFRQRITCGGVAGPVVVNVVAGSGPYQEAVKFANINTSATNTITINGNGEILEGAPIATTGADRGIFILENTSFFTIDNLVVKSSSTFGTIGAGILLFGASNSVTIKNSTIEINRNIQGSNNAAIAITNNQTSFSTIGSVAANNVTIENNTIIGALTGISMIGAGNNNKGVGNSIKNNVILDFQTTGIYASNQMDLLIHGNDFSRPARLHFGSFIGIFISGDCASVEISANSMHNPNDQMRSTVSTVGIRSIDANCPASNPCHVFNNRMYNIETNGGITGIFNNRSDHWKYYHNSIDIHDLNAVTSFTSAQTVGFEVTGSSQNIEFINNIISIVRSGSIPKRAILIGGTGTKTINRNGYFIDLNQTAAEFTDGFRTFTAYQNGNPDGYDANSVFDLPDFASASTGLLRPASSGMNDLGQNLLSTVPTDFLDSSRTATPDPGAFEFDLPPCPRPTVSILNNTTNSALFSLTSGSPGGTYEIEWGPSGFPLGTGATQTITQDSLQLTNLLSGTCYDVYVRLNCIASGNGTSPWSLVNTFCTSVCDIAQTCFYTFRMTAQYSSGWMGNTMTISQNGIPVKTIGSTFTSGNGPVDIAVRLCPGAFDVTWNTGGGFPNGLGIEILDASNNSVFIMTFNSALLRGSVIFSGVANCGVFTCLPPTGFAVSAVMDTSATFTFTPGNGVATVIEIGPPGFTPGTGIITPAISSPATVSGITPNRDYQAFVIDSCADGSRSTAIGPLNFKTVCLTASMPYVEDYSVWPNPCWTFNQTNPIWVQYNTGGVNYASINFVTLFSGIASMTTLPVNITTDAQVRYNWSRKSSTSKKDSLYVLSRIVGAPVWDTLKAFGDPNFGVPNAGDFSPAPIANFQEEIHYLPNSYLGNEVEFSFAGVPDQGNSFYMDFFTVEAQLPCLDPTDLVANSVTPTSIGLSWNQIGTVPAWDIEWGIPGFTPGTGNGTVASTTTNPFNLTGLTPGDCIDIFIRPNCTAAGNGFGANFIGPLSVCLPYEHDIVMEALVSQNDLKICGDSAMTVLVKIRNNGEMAQTNIPLTAIVSGTINQTLNITYPGPLAPGAADTVNIGTMNAFAGGYTKILLYSNLNNDQNRSNDSLEVDSIPIIPGEPTLLSGFTCDITDSIDLIMQTYPLAAYTWWDDPIAGNQLATGDTFRVPPTNPGPYYVEYKENNSRSLTTLLTGGSGCSAGTMFDLIPSNQLAISGFDIRPLSTSPSHSVEIYMVEGSYSTTASQADWTLIHTTTVNATANTLVNVTLPNTVPLTPNQTYGFYVLHNASYTVGLDTFSTADLTFISGSGNCTPFDYCCSPRTFNGIIHYETPGCDGPRVPVTGIVYTDPANADFTFTKTGPGQFSFDATNSTGAIFDWDFGDGSTGSGVTTSHSYTQGGTYTVTLAVTTVCNNTDVTTSTINTTISAEEWIKQQSLKVFPNPSPGVFNVVFDRESAGNLHMRVWNPKGQLILEHTQAYQVGEFKTQIDLSGLAKGIYLLQVQTENGLATRRLNLM